MKKANVQWTFEGSAPGIFIQNLSVKDGLFNIRNIENEKIGQPYYSLEMRNFLKDKAKEIYDKK